MSLYDQQIETDLGDELMEWLRREGARKRGTRLMIDLPMLSEDVEERQCEACGTGGARE